MVPAASSRPPRVTEQPALSLSLVNVVAEIRSGGIAYLGIALVIVLVAALWAFLARPVFESQATIAVESGSTAGQSASVALGGLASLAGLSLGGESQTAEIIATLKARGTAVDFISREGIAGILLGARWDANRRVWVRPSGARPINAAYAYEVWHGKVLHISQDPQTNLVTVAVDWHEPNLAAQWNTDFLKFADSKLRDDALREAEASIGYLNSQLSLTRDVEVRLSIANLLEQQLKTETLAKVRTWYALRVIDPPAVPIRKSKPNRALIVVLGLILSGAAVFLVALSACLLKSEAAVASSARYANPTA